MTMDAPTQGTADAQTIDELRQRANLIRQHVIEMSLSAQGGHQGGALSLAEIMAVLYFHVLRVKPTQPDWPDRDRLILSKGHGCLALYSALAQRGYFPESELSSFDQVDSILQGHPDMLKTPGVEMSTGCLGQGLSTGVGMALGARLDEATYRVYVILGDGELQSGQVWEAAMTASAFNLDNLTAIVDRNQLQMDGQTEEIVPLEPLADRWRVFGWRVVETDGHDVQAVLAALEQASRVKGDPGVVIAHTVKGKGVSFMEGNKAWHSAAIKPDEARIALKELSSGGGQ
jgi:transketolase